MKLLFWSSFALIIYTHLGYPAWLYLHSRWRALPVRSAAIFPEVSVIMAVHNEERVLMEKLRNLAELDYPRGRCEIIAVSDGSSDATNRILTAQQQEYERLKVIALPEHAGKPASLNQGIEASGGEIVVFTDARQIIAPDALRRLVANFADSSVGCVTGALILSDSHRRLAGREGLGLYWKLETKVREWESATGSVVGATGALYAARKELLIPLPADTLLDDVYIPLHVVRQGKRVIFEPKAFAFDTLASARQEFRRKLRTLAGNYQLLRLAPWLLTRANPMRFEFVSHKLLRLLVPLALSGVMLSSLFLRGAAYELILLLQVVLYGSASLAMVRRKLGIVSRLADVSLAFLLLNTAAAVAFVYFVTGKRVVWGR